MTKDLTVEEAVQSAVPAPVLRVYKYDLNIDDYNSIQMPRGGEVLTAQLQNGLLKIWAVVDPDAATEQRKFRIAGTGHPILDEIIRYLGTFQMHGGALIFHVFEVRA